MQNYPADLHQQAISPQPFQDATRIKLLDALNNSKYVWRTVDGLVKETGLSKQDVLAELATLPQDTLAITTGKDGTLYTTRDHYFKSQSFLGRFLTAATGQFK